MSERKYSVTEIDAMREAILHSAKLFDDLAHHRSGVPVNELREEAEKRLHTYMAAGVDPNDVITSY